jgi:hypothetical protein
LFAEEANIGSDTSLPFDTTTDGFLYDWFGVFWEVWLTVNPQHGVAGKDAAAIMEVRISAFRSRVVWSFPYAFESC